MSMKDALALAIKWLLTEEAKSSWLSILANPEIPCKLSYNGQLLGC